MNYKIYPNVELGNNSEIGDFVIIGISPKGAENGEYKTVIGNDSIIRSHTVIYAGNVIGTGFQTGHDALIREFNKIGNDVSVGSGTIVEHHVTIGHGVRIHSQAFIPEYSRLEDNCWIGPNVVITNAKYPRSPNVKDNLKGAAIGTNAIIGANATILPGVTIGQYALIGAGSVVTKNVNDYAVVAGNPAKLLKNISDLPYQKEKGE